MALAHHDGELDTNGDLSDMGFQDLDPLGRSLGFLTSPFGQSFGVGNGILQCRYAI